jgi:hypothetical protein
MDLSIIYKELPMILPVFFKGLANLLLLFDKNYNKQIKYTVLGYNFSLFLDKRF